MICWRIYYGDRSTVDNTTTAPADVPKTDVQYIRQRTPSGVDAEPARIEPVQGENYYCWQDDRWIGHDRDGMVQYLMTIGSKVVLFGFEIGYERWAAISEQAGLDPDFQVRR